MEVSKGELVVPGTKLCSSQAYMSGPGTYELEGEVFASLVGRVKCSKASLKKLIFEGDVDEAEIESRDTTSQESEMISVISTSSKPRVVPVVHSVVTCRVTKVNPRFAVCEILCVGSKSIPGSGFTGIIRKENVRDFEVDRVEMHESFRPGDIVRAVVASLGTARSYALSTAQADLGVVSALSAAANEPMIPISFDQMKCPVTGTLEKRKVAKINVSEQ